MRCRFAVVWSVLAVANLITFLPTAVAADAPEEQLKAKGLHRAGPTFVLSDEREVMKQVRDLEKLKRALFAAKKEVNAAEKKAQGVEQQLVQARRQRSELRRRLAAARTVRENNQLVPAIEELDEKIPKLEEQGMSGKGVKEAVAAESKAREAYVEAVMTVRKLHDATAESYSVLKNDKGVAESVDAYNATAEKKVALGPSTAFTRVDAALKRIEETVLSESIPLKVGDDDLLYVEAVFCGKHVYQASISTGASVVIIPYSVAGKIGVLPSPNDPTTTVVLVDKRTMEVTPKVIPKLRVGKFEAEKVNCYVLPADARDTEPILGQSFLNQFTYKLDPAAKTLVMTRVE